MNKLNKIISFSLFFFFIVSTLIYPQVIRKAPYLIYNGNVSEMQVLWQTFSSDTCQIQWGTDTLYSLGSAQTYEYGADHQHTYTITNLVPGTKYYYRVFVNQEVHSGTFRSAPDSAVNAISLFVYGDTRSNPGIHDQVAAAMEEAYNNNPELQTIIISVGDLVTNGDNESYWDSEFFNPSYSNIQGMLGNLPYQSCIGNHEGTGVLFKKYFPYPFINARYWSFDYGPAHFVVVDQYTSYGPGSSQLNWIENDLASTTKPWKFIYLHEPGWSAGGHQNNVNVQNYIQPLCEQFNVPVLFGGHNHYYARAVVNGIQHITTGGGGAPLYQPDPNYPNIVTATMANHFCEVNISNDTLHFNAITPSGEIIDSFTIVNPLVSIDSRENRKSPRGFILQNSYPNPFNPTTKIKFTIPKLSMVQMKVFDVLGNEIETLVNGEKTAGTYEITWNAVNLPSGVYFYKLTATPAGGQAGNYTAVKKMILLR